VKKIAEMASMATKALATAEQAKLYESKGAATDESKSEPVKNGRLSFNI
jgi:hypothetical protein